MADDWRQAPAAAPEDSDLEGFGRAQEAEMRTCTGGGTRSDRGLEIRLPNLCLAQVEAKEEAFSPYPYHILMM